MNYPLKDIARQQWERKVNCTSMYTIPAEDEAYPVLQELNEILTRLLELPLAQTLDQSAVDYFFIYVFPTVCSKIIRSRYFKNPDVLKFSNLVLQKSVYLTAKYVDYAVKNPKFLEILINVFSDEYYFKNNNQLSYMMYPYSYFPHSLNEVPLEIDGFVDVIKTGHMYEKVTWSQGQVVEFDEFQVLIAYLYDGADRKVRLKRDSPQIASFKSKSKTFQWRFSLKTGDLVDVEDSFGSWYNGTVLEVIDKGEGKKSARVTLKVYNEIGNKQDQNGSYFGFSEYEEVLDVTSPKIAPYSSVAKQLCYDSSKTSSTYDTVQDLNDYQFTEINGEVVYSLPRKKNLSQFQFQTINQFGKRGGFDKYMDYLEKEVNLEVLCYFVKGISGVTPYLHRELVKKLVEKIRVLFQKYLFNNSDKSTKSFTKQQSQMTFSGLKALQKRIYSNDYVSKYENGLKMKLVEICLQSEAIKSKLLGLNELKDIVRSVSYTSEKNKYIRQWVKNNKIFEKIYIINSHVQLIKKSEEFFKYLINQNILEVTDLQKLYKMAQKGDFQSRVSLYKLFQQVSHIFKKEHVEFLIDTILQSELNLVLNEDIDLLHELSRFSNYFPLEKVVKFFESIILSQNRVKELNDYAIKKYSEIVAKNPEMKPHRRTIIKNFLDKISTHDITQVTKVLKGIFDGISVGDWGKKDLNQILVEDKVDQLVVQTLKKAKSQSQFSRVVTTMLDFLLFIYKLSHKAKINIKTLDQIWDLFENNEEKQKQFCKWANQISKCEQGFQQSNTEQLQNFYRKVFTPESIPELQGSQFELAKNLFIQINKKLRYIMVSSVFKERQLQKEYKRKVQMKTLKLIDLIVRMIYFIKSETIKNQVLSFFIDLYTSKENSQAEMDEFLTKLLSDFKTEYENKDYTMLLQTIRLIQVVINDSEKTVETNINSLISKKESDSAKFIIINEVSFISSDSLKKSDLVIPMNTTIMRLRKILGKKFNITWQEVKIVSHKQIEDYDNSRTLKEVKLNPNQPLTISRRITSSVNEQQLMINDELSPKAVRCLKVIFEKYSTNGLMDKPQCNAFTTICLGANCSQKYYNEKITSLYAKYDDDNDGFLTFDNFLKFYEEAARDRPSTVWSNLKSFGVRGDFRFNDEPEELIEISKYPRNIIAEYPKVYDMLLDLLHIKEMASVAFELLERLPVSKTIQEQLIGIQSDEDLKNALSIHDLYEFFYKLNIIEYLAHSTELQTAAEKNWHAKFIKHRGYELLYDCFERIIQNEAKEKKQQEAQEISDIIREIAQTSLNLLNNYWTECFSSDALKMKVSLMLISGDEEIDDKMDYLVYGRFFKSQRKLEPGASKLPKMSELFLWRGKQKLKIQAFIIPIFVKNWLKVGTVAVVKGPGSQQKLYSITTLINKFIDTLNILSMNEDPRPFISVINILFDNFASLDLTRRLYCLILSQCFFTKDSKNQGMYIRELFKNLTKRTITSQLFRVLAVLVSRFGIYNAADQGEESQQTTKKLKQVLFENVLKNDNELTVEGCAKLLVNFNIQGTSFEIFEKIWDQMLFNPSTFSQKQQSKQALYQLILKICDSNPELLNPIIKKVLATLNDQMKNMKITYCNEFKQRSSTGYAGLKNLGSTCYINSMIQQLYMNKNFRYCILRAEDGIEPNLVDAVDNKNQVRTVDDNFLHQLQRIFANLELTNRIDFVPRDFCIAYKPNGSPVNVLIQQDVQQFISMFFDQLESGLSKTVFKKLVSDFYVGKAVNLFKCHSCQKTKQVEQNFHSIGLQVKTSKTLAQSFNRFCHGEMISEYKCQFCQQKVDVTKKTRIGTPPKMLIIHLQRLVFNLDTFIMERISTKHSFPHNFNLYESTLEYYLKKQKGEEGGFEGPPEYNYNLIGIICHTGTADSGHYISYIKTSDGKWIEFNDSQVIPFNPANIETECFGGYFASTSFDDQFFEEKKQSSKSAYILIYEKEGENTIELLLNKMIEGCKNEKEKQKIKQSLLEKLDLKEDPKKKAQQKAEKIKPTNEDDIMKSSENQNTQNATSNVTQSHEESSSAQQDSETQTKKLLQEKEIEIRRHQSQDNIDTQPENKQQEAKAQENKQPSQQKEAVVFLQNPISPYVPQNLRQEIILDNNAHFFQKCLSSASFVKFFSKLISKPNDLYEGILPICQKLTFGFWLKSPSFKDLLAMLDGILKVHPQGFDDIVTNNPAIVGLLIESSDQEIRTSMANFLSKVIAETIEAKGISIQTHNDDPIFKFLDKLFLLLPSTVSRCWTKFGQYFQFWYELSNKGERLVQYMIDREVIKHFMDYFLDTKSPLKIYATKREHPIGSSYANPNFSMLLKCVFSLLQQRMILNQKKEGKKQLTSNPDQEKLLMSFESMQKLIADNYENIASQLIKEICPHNLAASEKAAVVIIKGLSKSNTENVQPYLQILHEFALIEDEYQDLRIKWVIGKQTLAVSNLSIKIIALNSYSLSERLHNYQSSINMEGTTSLLQPILTYHTRIETFALLCTKQVFRLCDVSKKIRDYIFSLDSPTLATGKFVDFFKGFIDKYNEDHKKSYGLYSSSVGFNREQFGKEVKELYERVVKKVQQESQQAKATELKEVSPADTDTKNQQEKIQQNKKEETKQQTKQQQKNLSPVDNKQFEISNQDFPTAEQFSKQDQNKQKFIQFEQIEQSGPTGISIMHQENVPPQDQPSQKINQAVKDDTTYSYQQDDEGWERLDVDNEVITQQEPPKRGNRGKGNLYNINVVKQRKDKYEEELNYTDEESDEPLMKSKEAAQREKDKEKDKQIKDYKEAWHPVKFEYIVKGLVQVPAKFPNLKIQQHESIVTYVITKPTGVTNRSFNTMGNSQKTYERMSQQVWRNQKQVKVHGFYAKNNGRDNLRVMTNDGCAYVKSNENLFIWADEIVRIWESDRCFQWPKWSMYS